MNAELIVNLWAVYDSSTRLVYALSGRVYNASGSDTEKLNLLRHLSGTDYVTAKRYEVPERFVVEFPDGSTKKRATLLGTIQDPNAQLFEDVFKRLESELPSLPEFLDGDFRTIPQKLPLNPLCIITALYEDEFGNIRSIVTDEDRAWVALQEKAHDRG